MNQEKSKNSRWYRLGFDNENIPQKSIHSKDSSIHSKYTPTKNLLKSPETRLNIPALKGKVVPIQQVKKHNGSRYLRDIGHKSELMDHKNQDASINSRISVKKLNTSVISSTGKEHFSNHQLFKNSHQDHKSELLSSRKNNLEINNENRSLITQCQKYSIKNNQKSVEQMYNDFLLILNSMEKDLQNERISIIKMLDEKQRLFLQTKQKIMSAFVEKQKQMKRNQSRNIVLQEYIPREEQKNTLARVTSQKVFTRAQKQQERKMDQKIEVSHNSKQKSQCVRSSGSKTKSEYRSNFDVIFGTINEMKNELEVIESSGKVPSMLEYETRNKEQKNRITRIYKQNENKRHFMLEMPVYTRQFGIEQGKFSTKKTDPYNI